MVLWLSQSWPAWANAIPRCIWLLYLQSKVSLTLLPGEKRRDGEDVTSTPRCGASKLQSRLSYSKPGKLFPPGLSSQLIKTLQGNNSMTINMSPTEIRHETYRKPIMYLDSMALKISVDSQSCQTLGLAPGVFSPRPGKRLAHGSVSWWAMSASSAEQKRLRHFAADLMLPCITSRLCCYCLELGRSPMRGTLLSWLALALHCTGKAPNLSLQEILCPAECYAT